MNQLLIDAFSKAEKGWHTVNSIIVPYIAECGRYNSKACEVFEDCLHLTAIKKLKSRIGKNGRYEFKLA